MKIKHYLKLNLCLFVIASMMLSCEKDTVALTEEEIQESNVKRISLQELNVKLGGISQYKTLTSLFEENLKANKTEQKSLDASNLAWIMTDEIVMIEREDATFYTFRIGTETEQNEFYNFVLGINYDNTLRSMRILEYIPADSWLEDTSAPFVGEVKSQDNIFSEEDVTNAIAAKSAGQCIIGVSTSWNCNAGENHAPNTCLAGGSDLVVNVQWGACPPELTTGDDGNDNSTGQPINTGGTGGSGGSVTSPNDDCVPAIDNPCDDDETVVLTPPEPQDDEEIDCDEQKQRLLNLVNNETIKQHINDLKLGIHSDLSGNYKEDGVRFAKTGANQYTPRYPSEKFNAGVDYTPDYQVNEVVSVHIHQTKYWDLMQAGTPFFNAPVPSDADVIELMKNIKYIKDNNPLLADEVTQIVMTEAGVFAIVMEPDKAIAALNALEDPKVLKDFKDKFNNKVLKDWKKVNQNAGETCDADCLDDVAKEFKKFMKKLKIGGSKVKPKVLRAVIGNNNQITGWLCDE